MVSWQDFQIIVLVLVVMQISMILVVLRHYDVIDLDSVQARPPLENTVAHLPKPPASPTIFTPTTSFCNCNQY